MPDRSRKKKRRDLNEMAKSIVDEVIDDAPAPEVQVDENSPQESGRRGGLKGGKARAARLTAEQRRAIAEKAAQARWRKSH